MNLKIPELVPPAARIKAQAEAKAAARLARAIEEQESDEREEVGRDPDLVGLNLIPCLEDLARETALIGRVRKIVCHEEMMPELPPHLERVAEKLRGKLYFPKQEGRMHQMPMGNAAHGGLPSRWWITNLDYRRVLTGKLRSLIRSLQEKE